jgi:hypothetical protein
MFKLRSLSLCVAAVLSTYGVCSNQAHAHDGDRRHEEGNRGTIALDLEYAGGISNDYIEGGGGGALRIGSEHDLILVTLIPELSLGYHSFSGVGRYEAKSYTGMLGGRIRFLKILEPGIFAHAGIGHIDDYESHTGFAMDVGATLDFTLLPLIDLGVHAAWNRVFETSDHDGLSYGTTGFHVALVL